MDVGATAQRRGDHPYRHARDDGYGVAGTLLSVGGEQRPVCQQLLGRRFQHPRVSPLCRTVRGGADRGRLPLHLDVPGRAGAAVCESIGQAALQRRPQAVHYRYKKALRLMSHYLANVRDLAFNLFEVLPVGAALDAGGYGDLDADTARSMLDEVARLAEGIIAESFVEGDRNPPVFKPDEHRITVSDQLVKTVRVVKDAEWWRAGLDERAGGTPAPAALVWAIHEMLMCANPSAMFFYGVGPSMAHALAAVGTEQQQRWARMAMDKGWAGTMVLTEPDAGSDVGAGRAKAIAQPDGTWHIEGVKRFISG